MQIFCMLTCCRQASSNIHRVYWAASAIYTFPSTCYKYYFWNLMLISQMEDALCFTCFSSARNFGFTRQKCNDVKYLHNVWDARMVRDLAERSLCSLFPLPRWSQFLGGFLGSLCTCFWWSGAYSCICLGFMGWQCHKDPLVRETTGCNTVEGEQFCQNRYCLFQFLICPE